MTGAGPLAVLDTLDEVVATVERSDAPVYVRFAKAAPEGLEEPSVDGETGLQLPGVSANPLMPPNWWRGHESQTSIRADFMTQADGLTTFGHPADHRRRPPPALAPPMLTVVAPRRPHRPRTAALRWRSQPSYSLPGSVRFIAEATFGPRRPHQMGALRVNLDGVADARSHDQIAHRVVLAPTSSCGHESVRQPSLCFRRPCGIWPRRCRRCRRRTVRWR